MLAVSFLSGAPKPLEACIDFTGKLASGLGGLLCCTLGTSGAS